jgi:hypothetical protein
VEGERRESEAAEFSGQKSETAPEAEEAMEQFRTAQGAETDSGGRADRATEEAVRFPRPFDTALSPGRDEYSRRAFYELRKKTLRARKAKR